MYSYARPLGNSTNGYSLAATALFFPGRFAPPSSIHSVIYATQLV